MRVYTLKAGIRPKSLFWGDDRTIDPGVSKDVTFEPYSHCGAPPMNNESTFDGTRFRRDKTTRDQHQNQVK